MEMRQLQYFLVLCKELNYSHAAEKLYLSRQALRQSMAALEKELGEPLFENQRNRLFLTERGQWLCHYAQPVVQSFEQLQRQITASIKPTGPVRLGISSALVPDYLPRMPFWVEQVQVLYPNLGLKIELLPNDTILNGVEQERLEMGLVMDMDPAFYGAERQVLRRDPLQLMAAQEHPLAKLSRLSLKQLQGQCLLLPSLRPEPFAALAQAFQAAGCTPSFELAPSFYEANYRVRRQGCICITRPDAHQQSSFFPTRDLPLAQPLPPLCVSFVWSKKAVPAVVSLVRQSLAETGVAPD